MAFDGSTPCWFPTIPISETRKPRIRIAQFGDGYEQRILDGINAYEVTWSLTFEHRKSDIIASMEAYLEDQKGTAFPFKHPVDGNTYMVFCDEWRVDWSFREWVEKVPHFRGTLSAEFRKANGAGI